MIDINQRLFSTYDDKHVSIDIRETGTLIENRICFHGIDFKPIPVRADYLKKFGFVTDDEIRYSKTCSNGDVFTIVKYNEWTWLYERSDRTLLRIDSIDQLQDKYWELTEPTLAKAG
jgi:hypothetical protein